MSLFGGLVSKSSTGASASNSSRRLVDFGGLPQFSFAQLLNKEEISC